MVSHYPQTVFLRKQNWYFFRSFTVRKIADIFKMLIRTKMWIFGRTIRQIIVLTMELRSAVIPYAVLKGWETFKQLLAQVPNIRPRLSSSHNRIRNIGGVIPYISFKFEQPVTSNNKTRNDKQKTDDIWRGPNYLQFTYELDFRNIILLQFRWNTGNLSIMWKKSALPIFSQC